MTPRTDSKASLDEARPVVSGPCRIFVMIGKATPYKLAEMTTSLGVSRITLEVPGQAWNWAIKRPCWTISWYHNQLPVSLPLEWTKDCRTLILA